jgi:hypothetical protein
MDGCPVKDEGMIGTEETANYTSGFNGLGKGKIEKLVPSLDHEGMPAWVSDLVGR